MNEQETGNRKVILIGYRGTGKTTVARLLGERLGHAVFDSDPAIERRAGKTIADIFAQHGEAAFRTMEAEMIAEILERAESLILATGGGAVLKPETRDRLAKAGHVIWLKAMPETILGRIQGDAASKTMRPSLTDLSPLEEIEALLEKRHEFYADTAHHTVETDSLEPEKIVEIIRELITPR